MLTHISSHFHFFQALRQLFPVSAQSPGAPGPSCRPRPRVFPAPRSRKEAPSASRCSRGAAPRPAPVVSHLQPPRALAPPPPAPQRPRRRARACACACALGPKSGRAAAGTRRAAGGAANGRRRWLEAGRRGLRGC